MYVQIFEDDGRDIDDPAKASRVHGAVDIVRTGGDAFHGADAVYLVRGGEGAWSHAPAEVLVMNEIGDVIAEYDGRTGQGREIDGETGAARAEDPSGFEIGDNVLDAAAVDITPEMKKLAGLVSRVLADSVAARHEDVDDRLDVTSAVLSAIVEQTFEQIVPGLSAD